MKTKILFLGMILSLLTVSCNRDKDDDATISSEDASISAKLDAEIDDVSEIGEDLTMNSTYGAVLGRTSSPMANSLWFPCNGISTTATTVGGVTTYTRTADYGTTGCIMPNGNVLRGKIIATFVAPQTGPSRTYTITFDGFQHNDFLIAGTKTLTRTMLTTPTVHPSVSININISATNTLNGNVHTRTGTRVREFVQGYLTPLDIFDNVFKITGSWTTTHPNSNTQTANITTPVMVKFSCANIIAIPRPSIMAEGVIAFARGTHTATLDFGNGSCDNTAIFTINGVAHTISIR